MGWEYIIQTFAVGAFPWVTQLKNLDIHYQVEGINIKSIFNYFACLFAVSIFTYFQYSNIFEILLLPEWYIFIFLSFLLAVLYIWIYLYTKDKVKAKTSKFPIVVNFVLYCLIFTSLTAGFGLLKIQEDYILLSGTIQDSRNFPVNQAVISIKFENSINKIITVLSNKKGKFVVPIKKSNYEYISSIVIDKAGYQETNLIYPGIKKLNIGEIKLNDA